MRILGTPAGLWSAIAAVAAPLLLGGWIVLGPTGSESGQSATERSTGGAMGVAATIAESLGARARGVAPFRPDGKPARVPYDPQRSDLVAGAYVAPKPVLVLTGMVGGKTPLAIIEGLPGHEGPALLGVGDTMAGLRIQRIKEGRVTITGMDTTWVLTVRGAQ